MASFAQRLTFLRESKDLKKKDLAQILNVSAACVSQYESGTYMPGHDILTRIAQHFNVSIDFLLANEGESFDLSQTFYDEVTYLDLINACSKIPTKNRSAFLAIANALTSQIED